MYNPDPFPGSNKCIQIIIMNAIIPFIYINITTIKGNTDRNESDKSSCTDDSFLGCC